MNSFHFLTRLNPALSYIVATALVVGFGTLQLYLNRAFGLQVVYLLFFPPVMMSAWLGGWRSGMLAAVLSALFVDYFFVKPLYQFWPIERSQLLASLIFIVEGFFISALGEVRLQGRQALLEEHNSLEQRVADRTRQISAANEQLADQIAERERVQAALKESESKFRSVVETASDAIVLSNQNGKIVGWNHGAEMMFGYKASEALNQPLALIVPAEFKASHEEVIARLREGAVPRLLGQPLDLRGRRRDGSEFPLELSLATWQEGEQKFYSGIMRDLTLRHQAEENRARLLEEMAARVESQVAEQRYRLLAEAIPQIVWTATADGATDYFNQHWFEYTGLTPEQSVGWDWQAAIHPDDQIRSREKWKQALVSGEDFEVEYRFRRHDGTYRWHLGRAVPLLPDEAGAKHILKWFGTSTDIEMQKSTEATSRFIAKAISQLTGSLDEQSIVQTLADLCAPALAEWCAVDLLTKPEDAIGSGKLTGYPAELNLSSCTLRRATKSGTNTDKSKQDKNSLPQKLYAAPIDEKLPGPWRALALRRTEKLTGPDIQRLTVKDAMLEEWREVITNETVPLVFCIPLVVRGRPLGVVTLLCTDAEHCVNEADIGIAEDLVRNAALLIDNARLLQKSQEANQAKDEFLAVLSHELRTPLTAILGWAQLLQSPALDEETRQRAFQTIERNSKAQVQLIEDLLDLSRIITGKLRLEIKPLNICPVLEGALDAIRPAAQDKDITLLFSPEESIDNGTGAVMGDSQRLQQVFSNLLSNAIKFTPTGGEIEIALREVESNLEISVYDNGQGISAEFLPHVFERFRQADSSSTRPHGGLGLGLAIVQHLVELHGGRVQVESKGQDQGTTFKVLLPLAPRHSSQTAEVLPPAPLSKPLGLSLPSANLAGAGGPNNEALNTTQTLKSNLDDDSQLLEGVRVLLVDDEHDTLDMLSAVLRNYGADVQACSSAQEALTTLPEWHPRVLVSDIGMPIQNGYDLIRQIRTLPQDQGGGVPAMALTAYARAADRDLALDAGFNCHVIKPVDPATLARQVAELAELPQSKS